MTNTPYGEETDGVPIPAMKPVGASWKSRLRALTAGFIGFIPVLALFADELKAAEIPFMASFAGILLATNNVLSSPAWRQFSGSFMPWLDDYQGKHRAE